METSADEKEVKLNESEQKKSKLGKANSKVNILIHSSQVSSISNPAYNANVMRNSNVVKEKTKDPAPTLDEFQKSRELASFLGVSQAQIFQKQQNREENMLHVSQRKISIADSTR